jgi:hypothetical protein
LVVLTGAWLVYLLWNVRRAGRPEIGSEIELAPNRKEYYDDEQLEGRRLEKFQLIGLGLLAISAVGLPLYWLHEPARQAGAVEDGEKTAAHWGSLDFATTADGGFNCAGCHGGMKAAGGAAPYSLQDPTTGEDVTRVGVRGFRSVAVFDVSQTDGEPLPEPVALLTGEDVADAYGRLERVAKGLGFSVADADYLNGANGTTTHETHAIEILASNAPTQRVKTLAHEIGHAILHGEGFDYPRNRSLAELEAESVAFVVCATLGIATDDYSFGYVAHWTGDKAGDLIRAAGDRVHKATATILAALDAPEAVAA